MIFALLATLFLAGSPAPDAPTPARDINFTFRNNSSFSISEMYWAGCNGEEWSAMPQLSTRYFPDGLLQPGQNVAYPLNPGCINLRLITLEGYTFDAGYQITAYDVYEWDITDDQITGNDYDDSGDVSDDYEYGDYGFGSIELVNHNGYEGVKDVFFRFCGTEWDSDFLSEGEVIQYEESMAFELAVGCWDAAVRMTDGEVQNWTDLNVQLDGTVRIGVPSPH